MNEEKGKISEVKGDRAIHFLEDMIKRKSTLENGFPGPYLSRYHGVSTRHQEKKKRTPSCLQIEKCSIYKCMCLD